jgi:hypothetical protein
MDGSFSRTVNRISTALTSILPFFAHWHSYIQILFTMSLKQLNKLSNTMDQSP